MSHQERESPVYNSSKDYFMILYVQYLIATRKSDKKVLCTLSQVYYIILFLLSFLSLYEC